MSSRRKTKTSEKAGRQTVRAEQGFQPPAHGPLHCSDVTDSKTVWLTLQKARTPDVRFGVRNSLRMEQAPTEKMGDLMVPQLCPAPWARRRVFRGRGEQECGSVVGHVVMGEPWNAGISGKGESTPALPGQWTLGV